MKLFIILSIILLVTSREHRPMAGGKYKPEPNDTDGAQAISYARSNFASKNDYTIQASCAGTQGYSWDKVLNVEAQIVNGKNYFITAQLKNGEQSKKIQIVVYMPASPPGIRITSCQVF